MAKKSVKKPVHKPAKKPAKAPVKGTIKSSAKPAAKTTAKTTAKASAKPAVKTTVKAPAKAVAKGKAMPAPAKGKAPASEVKDLKASKVKKAVVPSVMGKPKKDAGELEDEFLDDDIEMDPELAEFADDVKELEEADAESEKGQLEAQSDEEEEVAAPSKKTPKEKSASERRIKKERDLLSGIDRNGDLSETWQKFYETHKNEKAKPYSMRETFEAKSALQHVKLGWGFILSNINDRLEVLFKEGIKILISNYKS